MVTLEVAHPSEVSASSKILDCIILSVSGLLIIAFVPALTFSTWTTRAAVVALALPIGSAVLIVLVLHRDRSAQLLACALLWTVLAAFWSGAVRSALFGFVGRDLSAASVAGAAALWATARQSSSSARGWLPVVIVASASVAAVVGLLQVIGGIDSGPLALASGRPASLLANPVYFGAVCASAGIIATERLSTMRWWPWGAASMLCGVAVSLSGSRVALIATVIGVITLVAARRTVPTAIAGALSALALLGGVGLDRWVGAGRNAADRLAEGATSGRFEVWMYGLQAAVDRPLFGFGFGRFRPAVQSRFDAAFVRQHAANDVSQAWFDAHNVFIGLLVAVGLVGLCLFGAFVVCCLLSARGPLAWGLLPLAAHWLLQPVSVITLPLAAIMLGAAMSAVSHPVVNNNATRQLESSCEVPTAINAVPTVMATRLLVLVGVLLGSIVLAADGLLSRAVDARDASGAAAIGGLYLGDPVVSNVVAQVYAADSSVAEPLAEVIRWRERSATVEPDRPYWWTQLAEAQIAAQRHGGAQVSIDRALELQPTNVSAWRLQGLLSVRTGDRERLVTAVERLCELGQPECEVDVDDLLEDTEH